MADAVTAAMENLKIPKIKELKGTEKRDKLIAWEKSIQKEWAEKRVYEVDPPSLDEYPPQSITSSELREKEPKWFGCMAYPYLNGSLHAGHAFSMSKAEFNAGVALMQGKRALLPLGYHVTGLPIKACADKLVKEVEMFGPDFSGYQPAEEEDEGEVVPDAAGKPAAKEDVTKFTAKKSKANAKTAKAKYQFQILAASGIPLEEIHKFADTDHWLQYFPPMAKSDLSAFGSRIDWRRQFVTTPVNPYYDNFINWQITRLRDLGKIKFGKRYTIYSIKDGQACLDHDRASGEGINPQEYTAIKMRVLEWSAPAQEALRGKLPADAKVYLVPATLRPETMYGQTNCFVGPSITYGIFRAKDQEYYLVTERAAKCMAFQNLLAESDKFEKLADIQGSDVVGTLIDAPLSFHKQVWVLPMSSVKDTKGTGVVTSVPTDSPADYITMADLKKKPEYYGVRKEWVDKESIPIIETPSYGNACAERICQLLKISSPKDADQLEKAKELAYKEGYYSGVMIVGDFKGEKVEAAKPKVRAQLLEQGLAFAYAEPEGKVVSRSGDECIVALLDQWYLDYGEQSWKEQALKLVNNEDGKGINLYFPEAQNQFQAVLDWLNAWAISRSYGLGSKLPWDESVMVESLSDSTLYMAYYTLVPYLHRDTYGKEPSEYNVKPEQLTHAVFDYVFCRTPQLTDELVEECGIARETLLEMRRSFEYFYPLDLRTSGKDLIGNHLTFFIYNHIALLPEEYWPKSIRVNGHLMLNSEKMSKSTGNFMTLRDLVAKYGADAARIAIADAGDGITDANFEESVADNSILRLYNCREWCEEQMAAKAKHELRTDTPNDFQDKLFDNEMNLVGKEIVHQYELTNYKLALKGIYDFFAARDFYREACAAASIAPHSELVTKWIRNLALFLNPIAPHFAEFLWQKVLGEDSFIQNARFPKLAEPDAGITAAREFIRNISSAVNSAEASQLKKMAKRKEVAFDPKKPKKLTVFVNSKFPEWQDKYIDLLRELYNKETNSINDKELNGRIAKFGEMKKAMPFVQGLKKGLLAGQDVLNRALPFNETELLVNMIPHLKRTAGLTAVEIMAVHEHGKTGTLLSDNKEVSISDPSAANAVPGNPTYHFENVEA